MDKDERAWRLLRALADVPDEYLLDALGQQDRAMEQRERKAAPAAVADGVAAPDGRPASENARTDRRRGKLLTYRPAMRWVAVAAACLLVAIVVRVLPDAGQHDSATGNGLVTAPEVGAGGDTVANPIQEFESLSELEDAAGFDFQTPEARAPYDQLSYVLIDGEIAEVDYRDQAGVGYTVRKAASQAGNADDISGDYDVYPYQDTVETALSDGSTASVTVKGDSADALRVAVWSSRGYDYAIAADADAPALTQADLLDAVAATE